MGDTTAVLDVLARQRACRSFRGEPIDDETIRLLLQSATYAPSAENRQPWQFVVVTHPETRRDIWALARRAWAGGGSEAAAKTLPPTLHADVDHGLTAGFAGAPVTVVVGADVSKCRRETVGSSLFPAVQNLLVAATASGLGSALTTIATAFSDELSAIVGFPPTIVPVAVVPLGYPAKPMGRARREPVEDHAHRGVYGNGW